MDRRQPQAALPRLTRAQYTKLVGIGAGMFILSALAWWSLRKAIGTEFTAATFTPERALLAILPPVLLFPLFLSTLGLLAVMGRPRWLLALLTLLAAGAPFLFFAPTAWLAAAAALIFAVCLFFVASVRGESRGQVAFSIHRSIRPHLGFTVAVVAIAVSFTFYSQTVVSQKRHGLAAADLLSLGSVNIAQFLLPSLVTEYRPDMTLDEFILRNGPALFAQFAPREATGEGLPPETPEFSPDELMAAFREAVAKGDIPREEIPPDIAAKLDAGTLTVDDLLQKGNEQLFATQLDAFRSELAKSLGVPLAGDEPMSDVLRTVASAQLKPFVERHERLITPLLAAALAFVLLVFDWLYQLLVFFWASGLVWALLTARFFVLEDVPATQRQLTF